MLLVRAELLHVVKNSPHHRLRLKLTISPDGIQ
jgi:hypothetical protein